MDMIKYGIGATGLGGSLGDVPQAALSEGFTDVTPKPADPWSPGFSREDDDGTNYVGDTWAHRNIGACGRPDGNER